MIELTEKEHQAKGMVCLPLDNLEELRGNDPETSVEGRVKELSPVVGLFKVGKETFTRFGIEAIRLVQEYRAKVFLDLKYHDIPNTVKGAAEAATMNHAYMFNIHASGGLEMMKAARAGVEAGVEKYGVPAPKILGVTVLTSLDEASYLETFKPITPSSFWPVLDKYARMDMKDNEQLQEEFREALSSHGYNDIITNQVRHLAELTQEAGLDGIVCSAADVSAIKEYMPPEFLLVTPGVKGTTTPAGADQKRVISPGRAVEAGSTTLVVGRAITDAEDRVKAGREILQDIATVL